MGVHSKIGASGAYRWFACPGSIALIEQAPPPVSSPFAEEGTAAHELAEKCLIANDDAIDHLGTSIYKEWGVTEEMAEAVQVYLDVVRAELAPHKILGVEERFHLKYIHPDLFGTNDAFVYEPFSKLTIYDYKHGKGTPVEVENNKQMKYYAVDLVKRYDPDVVELVIVQPRCPHKDGPVRRWETTSEEILEWAYGDLTDAVKATEDPDAKLEAGDHCFFCPAKGMCPKIKEFALEQVKAEFQDSKIVLPVPEDLSQKELSSIMKSIPLFDAWTKSVMAYGQYLLENGQEVEDFKLVRKRSVRKWIDTEKVEKELKESYGDKIYAPKKILTAPQMEKMVGKKTAAMLLEDLWEKPEGGLTVASIDDRRPAIETSPSKRAVEDFS